MDTASTLLWGLGSVKQGRTGTDEPRKEQAVEKPERLLLTPEQVAEALGVSRARVYVLLRGGLPSLLIGRSRRIPADVLRRWVEERSGRGHEAEHVAQR